MSIEPYVNYTDIIGDVDKAKLVQRKQEQMATEREEQFWGEDGFSFDDVLDTINPLQHIPIISEIYEAITGDEQSRGANMLGNTLYGGPIGMLLSFFNSIIEDQTGRGMQEHFMVLFEEDEIEQNDRALAILENGELSPSNRDVLNAEARRQQQTDTHADVINDLYRRTQAIDAINFVHYTTQNSNEDSNSYFA